ncbi:Endoribonuclease L-PSP [Isosphaera pallida ATCC 43644]|uniref:Endoribonuclease L-PSP n=1 Tax=Isosphaera pallida (strain ATCC 43644 / DSM 9630 / IS1B) TaxID=575540 RepID=E8R0J8_ISOPI|nr:RidA family protein [Isosphaera pallida]ADV63330.1 Endoribonuclease L-PSP [Isosphaera pallida ATCC 43644]
MSETAETRVATLGLELPPAPQPIANYVPATRVGNLLYVSGHGPVRPDGTMRVGRVGQEFDLEQGRLEARQVGLAMLATLRVQLGSLDKVKRVVKVLGLVRSTDDFFDQPKVINGFSDLMVDVFGDAGRAARSALGTNTLPGGIAVEIEAIFEVRDDS